MDGQTVYIQTANHVAYKADAEPVAAAGVAAFDPTIGMVPAVLGLQVKPIVQADANAALLDVKTQVCDVTFENYTVTAKGEAPATTEIQVPRSCVQKFQATVHLPLDTDVLIGGMSTPNQPSAQTLYLVVRVSVST
jgi:hypothetical protein